MNRTDRIQRIMHTAVGAALVAKAPNSRSCLEAIALDAAALLGKGAVALIEATFNRYQQEESEEEPLFYLQDTRTYVGNSVLWWCPDGAGYTTHIDRAGKFTAAQVARYQRETDVPWPVEVVDGLWSQHVDAQDLPPREGQ